MGRAGYCDDMEDVLALGRWRAQVVSTIRGKRGQAFLRELVAALDAMPEKRLISQDLEREGSVCAIGSVGILRGIDMAVLDPEDPEAIAAAFGITHQLVREIEYMNDEGSWGVTEQERWREMRAWAVGNLIASKPKGAPDGPAS